MAYTKLGWVNNRAPALNQSNLNHMDQGIYDAHRELAEYEDIFTGDVDESVRNWLDEHPEATTTVQDGVITRKKLNKDLIFERPFRFIAASDIHLSSQTWYGLMPQKRMDLLIDALIAEHNKYPIDFMVIAGDLTTDNGFSAVGGTNYLAKVYEYFLSKLPFPVYSCAGNHDGYSDADWRAITGTDRQFSVCFEDMVVVFLDNFTVPSSNIPSGGTYRPSDYGYLREQMDRNPLKKFIVVSHFFNPNSDSEDFLDLVNDDRVLFLVSGHTHGHDKSTYGTKANIRCGNFSYSINPNNGYPIYNYEEGASPYGFQSIRLSSSGIVANYIEPEITYYGSDNTAYPHSYTIGSDVFLADGTMIEDTDFLIPRESDNNYGYETYYFKKHTYSLVDAFCIDKGTDLNNLLEYGTYRCASGTIAATLSNSPFTTGGFKFVVELKTNDIGTADNGVFISQTIYPASPYIDSFTRTYQASNGTFSAWVKVPTQSYDLVAFGTNIPSNSDLNNYKTIGCYVCVNASTAQSLSNCPTGSGFKLIVERASASVNDMSSYLRQTIIDCQQYPSFYYRCLVNGTWGAWLGTKNNLAATNLINTVKTGIDYTFTTLSGKIINGMAVIEVDVKANATTNATQIVATLPTAWKPYTRIEAVIANSNSGYNEPPIRAYIKPDTGELVFQHGISSRNYYGTLIYPILPV